VTSVVKINSYSSWKKQAMTKKINRPLLEHKKQQKVPLAGEVSPEQAWIKVIAFAVQERARIKE